MKTCLRLLVIAVAALILAGCQQGRDAYVLTSTNTLMRVKTNEADQTKAEVPISGLDSGDTLLQIDFRPKDKQLYGLTSNNRLVTVDTGSGACTYIGSGPFTTQTLTDPVMDINPVGDYARVIDYEPGSSATFNGRINLDDGTLIQTDGDGTLSFKANDTNEGEQPQLVAIAHSNSVDNATATTLYGLELTTQSLVSISTTGVLTTIATTSRGFTVNSGFDIVPDNDLPYVVVNTNGSSAHFFGLDLSSGLIDNGKTLDGDRTVRSLAVVLDKPKSNGFNVSY